MWHFYFVLSIYARNGDELAAILKNGFARDLGSLFTDIF